MYFVRTNTVFPVKERIGPNHTSSLFWKPLLSFLNKGQGKMSHLAKVNDGIISGTVSGIDSQIFL